MKVFAVVLGLAALLFSQPATAQDRAWLQIEAQPSLNTAMDRARAYASLFADVEGYQMGNRWYGIVLGPTTKDEAAARLLDLRRQNLIPADSFIIFADQFGQRFWPVGAAEEPAQPEQDPMAATPDPAPEPAPAAPVVAAEPQETLNEARAAEVALSDDERALLQEALHWYGFYDGKYDGRFGKGTRAAISAWQTAQGTEPTGILRSKEREALLTSFRSDKAEFGFETVTEIESGIEITLPLALISFDRYEPPFVRYVPKGDSGLQVLLISEPGGKAGLSGLYDILQSLEIVPPEGERSLGEDSFTLRGANDKIETLAYAVAKGGNIKGYLISWNRADSDRMARVLPAIQSSFRSSGDKALDPGLVPLTEAAKRGLLAGLEMRHPKLSRSGFFVDAKGTVLTTSEAVASCGKVVLERGVEARVTFSDPATGIAMLSPLSPLAPKAVARFATGPASLGSKVSASGYSYEDRLPAPVVTNGTVEDTKGLNGETDRTRLAISALPGDSGGPVLDATGAVIGMLLAEGGPSDKSLPKGVAFAASAPALATLLASKGITPASATTTDPATPDALDAAARGMTVLVSCWE